MHCIYSESLGKDFHVALHLGSFLLPDLQTLKCSFFFFYETFLSVIEKIVPDVVDISLRDRNISEKDDS